MVGSRYQGSGATSRFYFRTRSRVLSSAVLTRVAPSSQHRYIHASPPALHKICTDHHVMKHWRKYEELAVIMGSVLAITYQCCFYVSTRSSRRNSTYLHSRRGGGRANFIQFGVTCLLTLKWPEMGLNRVIYGQYWTFESYLNHVDWGLVCSLRCSYIECLKQRRAQTQNLQGAASVRRSSLTTSSHVKMSWTLA